MDYWREYLFRKTFGGTHEDFLDQPTMTTEWLIAIHNTVEAIRGEQP
jgi:hypothetical protein